MSRRMLVLGAGGFIGRSIVEYVVRHGGAELILHYRDISERLAIDMNLESHILDLLTCPNGALTRMIDLTSPDVVVNCTGLTAGASDDLRAANVDVVDEVDRRDRWSTRRASGAARVGSGVRRTTCSVPGVRECVRDAM